MSIKASDVGDWLRQIAGKQNHCEVVPDNYLVLRPGPNFDRLMSNLAPDQPTPRAPEPDPVGDGKHEDDNGPQQLSP